MKTDRRHNDRGFTLVELLVVISVLGVIVTALASTIVVILRTTPSTELRIDDARTTRSLVTWLSHDITSTPAYEPEQQPPNSPAGTPAVGFTQDLARSDCLNALGTNLLHMRWTENLGSPRTYVATYRLVPDGSSSVITRYTCSGIGSPPFANTSSFKLTAGLSNNPALQTMEPIIHGGTVSRVEMRLTAPSGLAVEFDIASRNPSDFFSP